MEIGFYLIGKSRSVGLSAGVDAPVGLADNKIKLPVTIEVGHGDPLGLVISPEADGTVVFRFRG